LPIFNNAEIQIWHTFIKTQKNAIQVLASMIIDPQTHQYANISVQTRSQLVQLQQIQLPIQARPFPLVGHNAQPIQSIGQIIARRALNGRAECTVDGSRVKTFGQLFGQIWNLEIFNLIGELMNLHIFAHILTQLLNLGQKTYLKVIIFVISDNQKYKALLSTKCYSVLAQDCSTQWPDFVVLMKAVQPNDDGKKAQKVWGAKICLSLGKLR
jgi:hypothetical protein